MRSKDGTVSSWLCKPGAMVNVITPGCVVDEAEARFITETVDAAMRRAFPLTKKYVYVHDFSPAKTYTSAARSVLTRWGIAQVQAGRVEAVVAIPPPTNALFAMGIAAAIAVLRTFGMNMSTMPSLHEAIERHRLEPR